MTGDKEIAGDVKSGSQPSVTFWLLLLMAAGAFLRMSQANFFYYNSDEAMHAAIASGTSLSDVIHYARYEIHPPLLYLLAHYWGMLSATPAFMRGLPLVFGLLLIPLYYAVGRELDRKPAGLAGAAIITFSHGCIIQSYVLRQYMPFLFFLSLALLFCLRWRESRRPHDLFFYTLCGILACAGHFSAIFALAVMALHQAGRMLRQTESKPYAARWLIANALIAAFACTLYLVWQPIMTPLKAYFEAGQPDFMQRLWRIFYYPLDELAYILPGNRPLLAILAIACVAVAVRTRKRRRFPCNSEYKSLLGQCLLASGLGMALYAMQLYPVSGTRRNLWLLPFIVPLLGWAAAACAERCMQALGARHANAGIGLLVALGLLLYSPERRFSDGSEYVWQQNTWDEFNHAMHGFGKGDVIITEKDDGIMLANLYAAMGTTAFNGTSMLAQAPYGDARILFNPYYPRNYGKEIFLATLDQAARDHRLDGARRIILMRMAWSRSPVTDLMTCASLPKQVITFPDFGSRPVRGDIERARAALIILSPETLRDELLSSAGKARACLSRTESAPK